MKQAYLLLMLLAAISLGPSRLSAQNFTPFAWLKYLVTDGLTVYDPKNGVTWLADANLAADPRFRFDLPLCNPNLTTGCIWSNGSMSYTTALQWIQDLNDANFLGHSDWQLPTTPFTDNNCTERSNSESGENFAYDCYDGAFGYLYYTALGFEAPDTTVPIPPNRVGPFYNFQPTLYWSMSSDNGAGDEDAGNLTSFSTFSFADGIQGGSTNSNHWDVLPMIAGKIPGTPPATGSDLQANPGGQTVYDPMEDVTWLADANLAAHNRFGLPICEAPGTPDPCVALDGSMNNDSAEAFVAAMNAYDSGTGYLGQTHWQLPPSLANCPAYNCSDMRNPMGGLYYAQFGLQAGQPVVPTPNIYVGPFYHLQPAYYWTCESSAIASPCSGQAPAPTTLGQFDFSFFNGYLSTGREDGAHFVMIYRIGGGPVPW